MTSENDAVHVEGVRLTSPDRVLYPEQGITKRALAAYYEAVAEWILPQLRGRPLTLVRCPAGRQKACFVQRRADDAFPDTLRRVGVPESGGGSATYLAAESLEAVLGLVQLGVLELHTWGSRRDRLNRPDRLVFDLDPGPGTGWDDVVAAALDVRQRLETLGLRSYVKTTGGKGVHVVAPLLRRHGWDEAREFAHAVARAMEREAPERYVAQSAKREREGRIFVDYLRNGWSASAVASYSPRARPGAPVSTPLAWEELRDGVRPSDFTVASVPQRLRTLPRDPWAGYGEMRQSITRAARETVGLG